MQSSHGGRFGKSHVLVALSHCTPPTSIAVAVPHDACALPTLDAASAIREIFPPSMPSVVCLILARQSPTFFLLLHHSSAAGCKLHATTSEFGPRDLDETVLWHYICGFNWSASEPFPSPNAANKPWTVSGSIFGFESSFGAAA